MTEAADTSAKAVMRASLRALRRGFVAEHPEADWQAADRAPEMLARVFGNRKPGVCAIYRGAGSEVDPRPLSEVLGQLGWSLALPYAQAPETPVLFKAWRPGDPLAPDCVGIKAPLTSAEDVLPDLIVAPLVAFDRSGGRLGQGGGYYDRTIEALRAGKLNVPYVGLAFSVQEVDSVPVDDHDQRLDGVLTEKEYIAVRKDL